MSNTGALATEATDAVSQATADAPAEPAAPASPVAPVADETLVGDSTGTALSQETGVDTGVAGAL